MAIALDVLVLVWLLALTLWVLWRPVVKDAVDVSAAVGAFLQAHPREHRALKAGRERIRARLAERRQRRGDGA